MIARFTRPISRPHWQPHQPSWLCVYVYLLRVRDYEAARVVLRVVETEIEKEGERASE